MKARFWPLPGELPLSQEEIDAFKRPIPLSECGSCGLYHRVDYHGDCRNDAERIDPFLPDGSDDPRYEIVSTLEEQMAEEDAQS